MISNISDALDSRFLSLGRFDIDRWSKSVLLSITASSSAQIVDAISAFANNPPHDHDSLTTGLSRLICNMLASDVFSKEQLSRLVLAHVRVLDRVKVHKTIRPLWQSLIQLNAHHPELTPLYAQVVFDAKLCKNMIALGALVHHAAFLKQHRTQCISVYVERVVASNDKVCSSVYEKGFTPLYASLTSEEMATSIVPVVERWLKRSPGATLEIIGSLFEGLQTIPIDVYMSFLRLPICHNMRQTDTSRQTAAIRLFRVFALKMRDPAAVIDLLNEVGAHLAGQKDGAAIQVDERIVLMKSIAHMLKSPVLSDIGLRVIEILQEQARRETHDDGRLASLEVLSQFVSQPSVPVPKSLVEFIEQTILKNSSSKPDMVVGHLSVLSAILRRSPDLVDFNEKLSTTLISMLEDIYTKNPYRSTTLACLSIFIEVRNDAIVEQYLLTDDTVFAPSFSQVVAYSVHEAGLFANVIAGLLEKYGDSPKVLQAAHIFDTSVYMMARPDHLPSAITYKSIQGKCYLAPLLVEAFTRFLNRLPDANYLPAPSVLVAILRRLVDLGPLTAEAFFKAALASHHSFLQKSSDFRLNSSIWQYVQQHWPDSISVLLKDQLSTLCDMLFSVQFLLSSDSNAAQAAANFIATTIDVAPELSNVMFLRLQGLMDVRPLNSLSEEDLVIFSVPDGKIAKTVTSTLAVATTAKVNRARQVSDEEWAAQVQFEIDSRKKSLPSDAEGDEIIRQDGVRGHVRQVLLPIQRALDVVRCACNRLQSQFTDILLSNSSSTLLEPIWVLAANQLTSLQVRQVLADVARCGLEPHLSSRHSALVAYAVAMACQYGASALRSHSAVQKTVNDAISCIMASFDSSRLLRGETIMFLMPLIQSAIACSSDPVAFQCTAMLTAHASVTNFPIDLILNLALTMLRSPGEGPDPSALLKGMSPSLSYPRHLDSLLGDNGLLSPHPYTRQVCLSALSRSPLLNGPHSLQLTAILYILSNIEDVNDPLRIEGHRIWCHYDFRYVPVIPALIPLMSHQVQWVRMSSAVAVGCAISVESDVEGHVKELISLIEGNKDEWVQSPFDIDPREIDRSSIRESAFVAIGAAATALSIQQVIDTIEFIVMVGFADRKPHVWNQALQSGCKIIGTDNAAVSVHELQAVLDRGLAQDTDIVSEGVIVLIGRLAQFLDPVSDSDEISVIFVRLLDALKTPAFAVQSAVSDCIAHLCSMLKSESPKRDAVDHLLQRLECGETYGLRKGAALGLAGLVKGLRISSLKKFGILASLVGLIKDKRPRARQGALLAFEALFSSLGKLFEPYLPHLIPDLLISFGDPSSEVREATHETTRTMMGHITGQGVKIVLPFILKALDDDQWRTKLESIGMLGTMAFCAPRQLCDFLPTIVPRLTSVLADPHPKVQDAAKKALAEIGSVIRNPEIQSLVPSLLNALTDPSLQTREALQRLLDTSFINSVDAPSLALIVPILTRGLRDRAPSVKRMAAIIVGTMCGFLRDISAALPYTQVLLSDLQNVLVDPIPDVRTASASALGHLFKNVGELHFPGLIDWLLELLNTNTSSVERNGGAQGLAEVMSARGLTALSDHLDIILRGSQSQEFSVREAYLEVWVYFPKAFGDPLNVHLERILPVIIRGLSDDKESVRSMALSAGKSIITVYGVDHFNQVLPIFQSNLRNRSWRVRELCCVLIGDILARICGAQVSIVTDGHIEFDVDDQRKSENEQVIASVLGRDLRDRLLSDLFIVQADSVSNVQQTSWLVWKSIVANSNRILSEIMPTLMEIVIESLADQEVERRTSAGKSLGSMIQRNGDMVLPIIIPILEAGLLSPSPAVRQGVCIGMSEVMSSASKDNITVFMASLIPSIRSALCDDSEMVRIAAAKSFETLVRNVGPRVVGDIVPSLVRQLSEESSVQSQSVLQALRQILQVRSGPVLIHLIPALVSSPATPFSARVLSSLADVYGPSIDMHIDSIIPWYHNAVANTDDPLIQEAITDAATEFVLQVHSDAMHSVVQCLCAALDDRRESQIPLKLVSAVLLAAFCGGTRSDFSSEYESVLGAFLSLLSSANVALQQAGLEGLNQLSKSSEKEQLVPHLSFVRQAVQRLARECGRRSKFDSVTVPGFCLPNGLTALLTIYQFGLLNGPAEQRQQAASALGDLVSLTSPDALRPYVVKITGPLIRIVGDRFPAPVKAAILSTLGLLLDRAGSHMKPFVPQLQATFTKNLRDADVSVRDNAAMALASLLTLAPRKADILVQEIVAAIRSCNDELMIASMTKAIAGLLSSVGSAISPQFFPSIDSTLLRCLSMSNDALRVEAAIAFGTLSALFQNDGDCRELFDRLSSPSVSADWQTRHGMALAAAAVIRRSGSQLDLADCMMMMQMTLRDTDSTIRSTGLTMASALLLSKCGADVDMVVSIMIGMSRDINLDVQMELATQLGVIGKADPDLFFSRSILLDQVIRTLIPMATEGSHSVMIPAQTAIGLILQLHRGRTPALESYLKSAEQGIANDIDKFIKKSRQFRTIS